MDEQQEYLTKIVDLVQEHSPPGFAKQWYDSIDRSIQRGTVTQPFGCLTVNNGEVSLANTALSAESSRT